MGSRVRACAHTCVECTQLRACESARLRAFFGGERHRKSGGTGTGQGDQKDSKPRRRITSRCGECLSDGY
eukprot:2019569-Pleurochrysis_carterae.AAC.1